MANSAGARLHSLLAIGHSLPSRTSDTIEFRLAHRAGRLQEAAATSDGHPSWFFRILLSDIVKRKHIRSNRNTDAGRRNADESHLFSVLCSLSSV